MEKHCRCLLVLLLFLMPSASVLANDQDNINAAELKWRGCVDHLSGRLKTASLSGKDRGLKIGSLKDRQKYQECAELKRDWNDLQAIRDFKQDIMKTYKESLSTPVNAEAARVEDEADFIARSLVETTRVVGKDFKMVGSPLFNNFLVHAGIKKEGFCYQWLPHLFKALAKREPVYFERYWGGANVGKITENNAVVIAPKGAALKNGIVYDPWRGAGKPYWRSVDGDTYKWVIRYKEGEF